MNTCKEIIQAHCPVDDPEDWLAADWKARHYRAWNRPMLGVESGIKALLQGFAALADGYAAQTGGERLLGQDGYFWEHARDMVLAMQAYLNFDIGRFDGATLARLIHDLAKAAGVELED